MNTTTRDTVLLLLSGVAAIIAVFSADTNLADLFQAILARI